jgi:hypothetical protein
VENCRTTHRENNFSLNNLNHQITSRHDRSSSAADILFFLSHFYNWKILKILSKIMNTKVVRKYFSSRNCTEITVVTGGNKGIGFAICQSLVKNNFRILLGARDQVIS